MTIPVSSTQHCDVLIIGAGGAGLRCAAEILEKIPDARVVALTKATVIASGGCGQVFKVTTNCRQNTGDGLALVLDAGLPVIDPEAVQFHPTGIVGAGILASETLRSVGGILRNRDQEPFMVNYAPKMRELAPRDLVARAIESEIREGRGILNPDHHTEHVWIDLRHLPDEVHAKQIPEVSSFFKRYVNLDPKSDLCPVRPSNHYHMGGIATNEFGEVEDAAHQSIRGLYAVGECAAASFHGFNRLGTNSILELITMGKITAERAMHHIQRAPAHFPDMAPERFHARFTRYREAVGKDSLGRIRDALRGLMTEKLSVFRTAWGEAGVPVIGTSLTAEASHAALANGAAAHAPELDDVVNSASLHPGVCVMPAALSAGHLAGATGKELIAAITAGYEVMVKLGIALDPAAHYARGFHPTGTCGVFGAAVAAAKLLALGESQMIHALGISGSQAAGLLEFLADGSFTKRFHAGWAAHSGLIAALLARDGFTGPATVIEGKFGFLKAYSPAADPAKISAGWGAPYEVMRTSIKPHACCRYKQGPIDCILKLVREDDLRAETIERITVSVLKAGFALVAEPRELKTEPKTIVDAQFSMPFGGAVAILKGNAFLDEYSLENIHSPKVKELMRRFDCVHDPDIETEFPRKWPAKVEIATREGQRFITRLDFPKGDPENPLTWDEVIDKFKRLTAGVFPEEKRRRIVARIRDLEHLPAVSELLQLTATPEKA